MATVHTSSVQLPWR